jgi:hypothetical protein
VYVLIAGPTPNAGLMSAGSWLKFSEGALNFVFTGNVLWYLCKLDVMKGLGL